MRRAAINTVCAIHPGASNGQPSSELSKGKAGSILSHHCFSIQFSPPGAGTALEGDGGAPIVVQGSFTAGIFSHL